MRPGNAFLKLWQSPISPVTDKVAEVKGLLKKGLERELKISHSRLS